MSDVRFMISRAGPEPKPLISEPEAFGVIWSAKSGSAQAMFWFFARLGLLDAATFLDQWPHEFRIQFLYRSQTYARWVSSCDVAALRWVRLIRDPYRRAVSQFRQSVLYGTQFHRMSAFLGRPVDRDTGLSFREYLAYLQTIDVTADDVHDQQQRHPIDDLVTPTMTINLDRQGLMAGLRGFEDKAGLPQLSGTVSLALETAIARVAEVHHATRSTDTENPVDRRFRAADGYDQPWPRSSAFLTDDTEAIIRRIYAADFEKFEPFIGE